MSRPWQDRGRTVRCAAGAMVVTVASLVACVVLPAGPAAATHQYCGKEAVGVHLGGYPGGTLDNGHKLGDSADSGYAGGGAVGIAKNVALGINRAGAALGMSKTLYDYFGPETPTKVVTLVWAIAKLASDIAGVAADAAVLALEQRVAEVNACNATLAGDTIDLLFVSRLQEELAGFDPDDGTVEVPSNLFLLPDDGSPEWTQKLPEDGPPRLYSHLPGHDALPIPYIDGMANTPAVGVAVVVRNSIAHLEAHGVDTGGGYRWVPGVGLEYQDGAKDLWWDGIRLLEDGRVRLAHAKFAEAYQMAVSLQTTP